MVPDYTSSDYIRGQKGFVDSTNPAIAIGLWHWGLEGQRRGWVLVGTELQGLVLATVPRLWPAVLGEHVRLIYVMAGPVADPGLESTCLLSNQPQHSLPSPPSASPGLSAHLNTGGRGRMGRGGANGPEIQARCGRTMDYDLWIVHQRSQWWVQYGGFYIVLAHRSVNDGSFVALESDLTTLHPLPLLHLPYTGHRRRPGTLRCPVNVPVE
ncbi:unnamed protein product [Pleuronectes platessa]|uniref:Uncharacterized protein n=1 Tax=Pleuronectes platessa TaxID=8262 RepID=A0A9N7UPC2_PLEPL|nr:unnamed protein product [Pleuronectes platessa]